MEPWKYKTLVLATSIELYKAALCLLRFKGWVASAKLKALSLFISLSLMLKKAFDNVEIEK